MRDEIERMIDRLFGDTSVPPSRTKADLEYLADHIESLIDTIDDDE